MAMMRIRRVWWWVGRLVRWWSNGRIRAGCKHLPLQNWPSAPLKFSPAGDLHPKNLQFHPQAKNLKSAGSKKCSRFPKFELKAADDSIELIPNSINSHSATDCQSSGQTCIKKGWAKNPFQGVKYINIARNCETALSSARNSMYSIYSRSVLSGVSWYVLTWPGLPWSNPVCPGLSWWSGKTTDPEGYMSRSWSYIFGRL